MALDDGAGQSVGTKSKIPDFLDQSKADEMGGACSTHGRDKKYVQYSILV